MGTIQVRSQQSNPQLLLLQKGPPVTKLSLNVDFTREVLPQLKQLQHWSLQEIREMYSAYQRKSQCPFIDAFTFRKILTFERPAARVIFEYYAGNDKYVSIYELICTLVVLAHHTYRRKMQSNLVLYTLFDFQHQKWLSVRELMLIYQSTLLGFCRCTGQQPPPYTLLSSYTRQYFLRGNPGTIIKPAKLRRLIEEIEGSRIVTELFNRYEHGEYMGIREDYMLYSEEGLKEYNSREVDRIYRVLEKGYREGDYSQVDLVQFNRQLRLGNRRSQDFKKYQQQDNGNNNKFVTLKNYASLRHTQSIQKLQTKQKLSSKQGLESKVTPSLPRFKIRRNSSFSNISNITSKVVGFSPRKSKYVQSLKPIINQNPQTGAVKSGFSKPISSRFLFLNQHTLSKRDMFQTISYFRTLSNNQQQIRIKQFFKSFEKKAFLRKQVTSLFRVIDTNKNGQISFQEFLKALYPDIRPSDIKVVLKWKEDYFKTYYADSVQNNQLKNNEQETFNILPRESIRRVEEIFKVMDTRNKGYLDYDDLVASFKTGYSLTDVENLLKEFGNGSRIHINEFVKMLLPKGWIIEGYNDKDLGKDKELV